MDLYENGVMLRAKYYHLLPSDGFFRTSNMRIITSVPDRCIMSLQSFMAGFFPPPVLDMTLPIYWQPFTFEIDYEGRMVYVSEDEASCPIFMREAYGYMANPGAELSGWLAADKTAFSDFATLLGAEISDVIDVMSVSDTLKIQQMIDSTVPQWAKDAYTKTFKKYNILVKTLVNATPKMVKIRGGPMITEMVENMVRIANGDSTGKKVLLYSAHDSTIASLAYALGVIDQIPEPISFSDTIMVDLVQNASEEPRVEVIYLDKANIIPRSFKLNVPGCGESCTLGTFQNAVKDMFVEDFDALCSV